MNKILKDPLGRDQRNEKKQHWKVRILRKGNGNLRVMQLYGDFRKPVTGGQELQTGMDIEVRTLLVMSTSRAVHFGFFEEGSLTGLGLR